MRPVALRPFLKKDGKTQTHGEVRAQSLRDFRIEKWKEAFAAIDERHFPTPHRGKNRRVFTANHATTHNDHAFWDAVHRKDGIGIENSFVIERNLGRAKVRLGAGRDQNHFTVQRAQRAMRIHGKDGVRIFKAGRPGNQFDFVRGKIGCDLRQPLGPTQPRPCHDA